MKKRWLILIFILALSPVFVKAADEQYFTLYHKYEYGVMDQYYSSENYPNNTYGVKRNGTEVGSAYCISPAKKVALAQGQVYSGHAIDPTDSEYYLALTVAYTYLGENNYLPPRTRNAGSVNSMVVRLIASYYSKMDLGGCNTTTKCAPYMLKSGSTEPSNANFRDIWNNRPEPKAALDIFQKTIKRVNASKREAGNNLKDRYQWLISKAFVWRDKYYMEVIKETLVDGEEKNDNKRTLYFKMVPKSVRNMAEDILWEDFKISCDSDKYGFKCGSFSLVRTESYFDEDGKEYKNKVGVFKVNISKNGVTLKQAKKAAADGKLYGLTVTTSQYDPRYTDGRIIQMDSISTAYPSSYQKMVIFLTDKIHGSTDVPFTVPVYDGKCYCETDSDGGYTGNYRVTGNYHKNGVKESFKITFDKDDKVRAAAYNCPIDTCDKKDECVCEIDSNGNYTGNYVYTPSSGSPIKFPLTDTVNKQKYNCPDNCLDGMCYCETDADGDYTGNYIYKDSLGNKTFIDHNDVATKSKFGCNDKCEKIIACTYVDGKYYGRDGVETNEAGYLSQCFHSCQTPSDNPDGNYYCKETSPGKGDGKVCDKETYEEECLCESLKQQCLSSSTSCDEYYEKCSDACSASVTLPSTCNDFNVDSEITGGISDINKEATACNNQVNKVKNCVLNGKDEAGNTFEDTSQLSGNRYCRVWCEESYKFNVPTATYTQSGGYFTLATAISATRNCYVGGADNPKSSIDNDKFLRDLDSANSAVVSAFNSYSMWSAASSAFASLPPLELEVEEEGEEGEESSEPKEEIDPNEVIRSVSFSYSYFNLSTGRMSTTSTSASVSYNSIQSYISSALSSLNHYRNLSKNYIDEYNRCSNSWSNNMKFDPDITYSYSEDYMNVIDAASQKFKQTSSSSSNNNVYCNGDTDDEFNCLGQSATTSSNAVPSSMLRSLDYVTCTTSSCTKQSENVLNANWILKSVSYSATYEPNVKFSTYIPYGTVKVGAENCRGNASCVWVNLEDKALPVELSTGKGAFPFKFTFKNIGQYSNGSLGRLIGTTNSVLTAYNKNSTCSANGDKEITPTMDGSYVCAYINNCDNCKFTCGPDGCSYDDPNEGCDENHCPVSCKSCIFDGNKANYTFRTVSLNNVFPNSCDKGAAECRDTGYNWSETEKGKTTLSEIEQTASAAYVEAEYSYIVTGADMQETKKYDKAVGTYANTVTDTGEAALKCEQVSYSGSDNPNITYHINCHSTFLDNGNGKYFQEVKRNTEFVSWTDPSVGKCNNGSCLDRTLGIGPSWK